MALTQVEFERRFVNWSQSIRYKYLDLDGFPPSHPWQCHDVLLSYLMVILGLPIWHGHAPGQGWTSEVWLQFPRYRPELAKHFVKRRGSAGIKRGDILFWAFGDPNYPYSHIAVALGPMVNGWIPCVSQNPGPVQWVNLAVSNILGYLEPILENVYTPPTPKSEETKKAEANMTNAMFVVKNPRGNGYLCRVFDMNTGERNEFEAGLEYADNIAKTYQCGPKSIVSESHFNKNTQELTDTRQRLAAKDRENSGFVYKVKDTKNTYTYLILNNHSGFVTEFGNGTEAGRMPSEYLNGMIEAFGISGFEEITPGHAATLKQDCVKIRSSVAKEAK